MLYVDNIRLPLGKGEADALDVALQKAGVAPNALESAHLHKISVDARRRPPLLVYSMALRLRGEGQAARFAYLKDVRPGAAQLPAAIRPGGAPLPGPVVVCGLGPAGLFAALELARHGYAPQVLERGPDMDARRAAVAAFEAGGALCENANIQFGEGGAGTFSDGKLRTRIKDPLCALVIEHLLAAGAPPEIAWQNHPHIGTDLLRDVFVTLRKRLCALGGSVRFNTRLERLGARAGRLAFVQAGGQALPCGALVLACGHSARDTFTALRDADVPLEGKAFSVGVRIEHLQSTIDRGLYHEAAGHPDLPPGEYQLATRAAGRGVYTFCMCPGGSVVAAASEVCGLVTNGMSPHARSGPNANAAVVAGVEPAEFGGDPFRAIAFQRQLEQAAYAAGGKDYTAPAETQGSFMQGGGRLALAEVAPTYPRSVRPADLGALLGDDLTKALREGLAAFGRKLPGFSSPGAVLTGLETRTSSPVRVVRGEGLESTGLPGLFPCGEGAGYAGGIMSAAVDGVRVARAIIERYAPPGG